jgi:hypothetical protein
MSTDQNFGESDAKRIIERAAEIDAREGQRLSSDALRAIAAEAGISPLAVDQAIHEQRQPGAAVRSWPSRNRALLIVLGILGAAFFTRLFP